MRWAIEAASLAPFGLCSSTENLTFPVHLGNKDKDNPSSSLSRILQGLSWGRSHQEGRVVVIVVGKARGWVWLRMPHPCFLSLLSTLQLVCALCCLLCHAIPSRALTRGALWWPVAWKALVPLKETGFPNGSVVKKKKKKKIPLPMQETQVQSLGQENPLEESMAARSSILA